MFQRIIHDRTADAVIRQIEERILDGVLRPGDRLPPERELAAILDVSRPILRHALKELELRGLLRSRHGEGTYVSQIIGTVFEEPMVGLVRRHPRAVFDFLEYRREMEGIACAYAAERATAPDLLILDQILAAMHDAHRAADPAAESRLDVEFHISIIEAAHNVVLLHMMRACYRLMEEDVFHNRDRLYAVAAHRERLLEQHRAIHDAIVAREPEAARAASAAHIDFVAEALRHVGLEQVREENSARRLAKLERVAARTAVL
jgi:GntR family transcriptional repressor for pyruvate dehydrogenase complex